LKALQEIVGAAEPRMAVALANIEGADPRAAESLLTHLKTAHRMI
jgi:hypothetical protein